MFFKLYIENIERQIKTNVKSFWRYTKPKTSFKSVPGQFVIGDSVGEGVKCVADLFVEYFESTYAQTQSIIASPEPRIESNYSLSLNS